MVDHHHHHQVQAAQTSTIHEDENDAELPIARAVPIRINVDNDTIDGEIVHCSSSVLSYDSSLSSSSWRKSRWGIQLTVLFLGFGAVLAMSIFIQKMKPLDQQPQQPTIPVSIAPVDKDNDNKLENDIIPGSNIRNPKPTVSPNASVPTPSPNASPTADPSKVNPIPFDPPTQSPKERPIPVTNRPTSSSLPESNTNTDAPTSVPREADPEPPSTDEPTSAPLTKAPTRSPKTRMPTKAPVRTEVNNSPQDSFFWDLVSNDLGPYGYSVSLSYNGGIMAVLNDDGIIILKQNILTKEWHPYGTKNNGNVISKAELVQYTGVNWEDMMGGPNRLTTHLTLSSDGTRLLWYITYLQDSSSSGKAIIFEIQDQDENFHDTGSWNRVGHTLTLSESPGGSESRKYGPIVAYARTNGNKIISGVTQGLKHGAIVCELQGDEWNLIHDEITWYGLEDVVNSGLQDPVQTVGDIIFDPMFGASVAITGEGDAVAIASPKAGTIFDGGNDEGKVEVYRPGTSIRGATWKQVGSDMSGEFAKNEFGIVSISEMGHRIVVGTPNESANKPGSVAVFQYTNGGWFHIDTVYEARQGGLFGQMVTISPDGSIFAAVAPKDGRTCMYNIFKQITVQIGECIEDGAPGRNYQQYSISLSSDGKLLAIGTPLNDSGDSGGHVKLYRARRTQD